MKRFWLSPAAAQDLEEISDRIAEDHPGAAGQFVDLLLQRCRFLAQWPLLGHTRPDIKRGQRTWSQGDYLIIYTVHKGGIRISRIVHGRRDLPSVLDP